MHTIPEEVGRNPEVAELQQETQALVLRAENFAVTTAEQYEDAAEELKRIKAAQKRLETLRTSITQPLNASLRAINDFFRTPKARLDGAERCIKNALAKYSAEQERKRREEQARLEAQARKERERHAKQAAKAAAAGRVEKAVENEQRAAAVVAPIAQTAAPKVTGLMHRTAWDFEVVDPAQVPREYLMVDEQKIRKVVGALKGDTVIAGVRVFERTQLAASSGR
jgi:hypothetical protein